MTASGSRGDYLCSALQRVLDQDDELRSYRLKWQMEGF